MKLTDILISMTFGGLVCFAIVTNQNFKTIKDRLGKYHMVELPNPDPNAKIISLQFSHISKDTIFLQYKTVDTSKHEYQMDISSDSLWLFDNGRKVDSGKFSQLEQIINKDNL